MIKWQEKKQQLLSAAHCKQKPHELFNNVWNNINAWLTHSTANNFILTAYYKFHTFNFRLSSLHTKPWQIPTLLNACNSLWYLSQCELRDSILNFINW